MLNTCKGYNFSTNFSNVIKSLVTAPSLFKDGKIEIIRQFFLPNSLLRLFSKSANFPLKSSPLILIPSGDIEMVLYS